MYTLDKNVNETSSAPSQIWPEKDLCSWFVMLIGTTLVKKLFGSPIISSADLVLIWIISRESKEKGFPMMIRREISRFKGMA